MFVWRTLGVWRWLTLACVAALFGFACSVPRFEFPDETAPQCADGVCESGCTTDANCPGGWLCCGGVCDNAQVSVLNGGACGTACESPFVCVSGGCEAQDCGVGHAECDGNTSDACETDTKSDPQNCGACGQDCGAD